MTVGRRRGARAIVGERGSTVVFVTVALAALVAMAALAVDIGMLITARAEAQRAADGAALAGAGSLIYEPGDAARARSVAMMYAARNPVAGDSVAILASDVSVDLAALRVTVVVRRAEERGTSIATWFARVFGVEGVDVGARATAAVESASMAACLKPWIVPDGWSDADADGEVDPGEAYDPATTAYGTAAGSAGRDAWYPDNGIDPPGTTYVKDRGRPLVMKPGDPSGALQPGWYYAWVMPTAEEGPSAGAARYRWNIAHCNPAVIRIGDSYPTEPGNMEGPTRQGVRDLIEMDPDAVWDRSRNVVAGSAYTPWESSPRIVRAPLFDPTRSIDPGRSDVEIVGVAGFFIEGVKGSDVVGRFMTTSGTGGGGGPIGPLLQYVHLVE